MHGSLLHLGWPLLCVRLGEGLRSPMALARLEAELDGAGGGGRHSAGRKQSGHGKTPGDGSER